MMKEKTKKKIKCFDLFEMPLEQYISNAFHRDKLLVFLHLPKAAGNSVLPCLGKNYERKYQVKWNEIDSSWNNFLEKEQNKYPQLVKGHFSYRHIKKLDKSTQYNAVVYLRHPVDRMISLYRYIMTPVHPNYETARQKHKSLKDFIKSQPENRIAKMIAGNPQNLQQYINRINNTYTFVGMTEFVSLSTFILLSSLGKTYVPVGYKNITKNNSYNQVEIDEETLKLIRETQSLDIELFNYVKDRYVESFDNFFRHTLELDSSISIAS